MENQMNLYEEYGKAMVDLEVAQNRVNQIKGLLVQKFNEEQTKEQPKPPVDEIQVS